MRTALRVLLDANVWREILDGGCAAQVHSACRRRDLTLLVAPSVVYEALRSHSRELRALLVELMTRPCWRKLMPDAYEESEEFLLEAARLRPGWFRTDPDVRTRQAHLMDWQPGRKGFWARARANPDVAARHVLQLDGSVLDVARQGAKSDRQTAFDAGLRFESVGIARAKARFLEATDGWDGDDVELWRIQGLFAAAGLFARNPFSEWLGTINLRTAGFPHSADWNRFWLYDVETPRMPRWWMRTAWQLVQSTRKPSDGTPCDGQLSTYMYSGDVFITCDRVLADILGKCRDESPVPMAQVLCVTVKEACALHAVLDELRRRPV